MHDLQQVLAWYQKHHRLTNYLSASMLYLKDNFFLEEPLEKQHIKSRILGHWGTVPGLNFIYGGIYYIASKYNDANILPIMGPGHGAPAVLSNYFLEGTISEYYDGYNVNKEGIENLIKNFSWPGGFPSHTYPGVPGTLLEGGELGYSLGSAFGAVMDNPDLIAICVVGDGESETGPLAASLHSNKFINPEKDGMVLPIIHLNGYRISGPTILGTMSDEEIISLYTGYGYDVKIVNQYTSPNIYLDFLTTLENSYKEIKSLKQNYNKYSLGKTKWPLIVLKTKKGWTCPENLEGHRLEDSNYSHGIPIENPAADSEKMIILEKWLRSYNVNDLLDPNLKTPNSEIMEFIPTGDLRLGKNKHAYGGELRLNLKLPDLEDHAVRIFERGLRNESEMSQLAQFLRDIFDLNSAEQNFRIFSPDETESNKIDNVLTETGVRYLWPTKVADSQIDKEGRVMEILSEHVLQEWYQGYVLTGRHGIYISYEAFLGIITTMIDQFIKYIKQSKNISWRKPLPSMNYLATSTGWRQEHNGFTHQNPTLINSLLTKQSDLVSIYFPADVNTMLVSMKDCLESTNRVNLIIAGKRDLPQWLSMHEAINHVKKGYSIWEWASTEKEGNLDIVLASAGDYQTVETLAAISILKKLAPEMKIRYVNINELSIFGIGDDKYPLMDDEVLYSIFSPDKQVIFNFHGYPEAIKQLTWGHEITNRMQIVGYREEGTTTTPFDMQILNGTSRYHIGIMAVEAASMTNSDVNNNKEDLINYFYKKITEHNLFIIENGDDMPEVKDWKWEGTNP